MAWACALAVVAVAGHEPDDQADRDHDPPDPADAGDVAGEAGAADERQPDDDEQDDAEHVTVAQRLLGDDLVAVVGQERPGDEVDA